MLDFKKIDTPWGIYQGVARTMISLGLSLTMLLTPQEVLFTESSKVNNKCDGFASFLFFCVTEGNIEKSFSVIFLGIILLIIATGVAPFLTAIPLFYIAASIYSAITIPDGGDQIAQIITFLLIPVSLFDFRLWSYSKKRLDLLKTFRIEKYSEFTAKVSLYLIKLQVAVIYFWAGASKLNEPAWREGTALYYWVSDPTFGASEPLSYLILPIFNIPLVTLLITWGTILMEVILGLSLLMDERIRKILLPIGIIFHILIFIVLGISSFGIIMIGALLLLLVPVDHDITVRKIYERA